MAAEHEDHEREDEHPPPPKFAPGPKLPKPAVPHLYGRSGVGYGVVREEHMPPER